MRRKISAGVDGGPSGGSSVHSPGSEAPIGASGYLYCVVLYCVVLCSFVLCCDVLFCVVLCCIVLCCVMLQC